MIKRIAVFAVAALVIGVLAVLSFGGTAAKGSTSPTAFDLPALQGPGRVRLDTYRGKPVVVTLFASWCTACPTELPAFARAAARVGGRVQFVAVDSQESGDGPGFAQRFHLAQSGFTLAKDIDQSSTGGLFKAYRALGLPMTVFYGADGQIRWKSLVAVPEEVLQQQLQRLYGV